jgi:hypothetical protein
MLGAMSDMNDVPAEGVPPRPVLAYAPPPQRDADAPLHVWARLGFVVTAGEAVATFFLPFSFGIAPFGVVGALMPLGWRAGGLAGFGWPLLLVAAPFLASFPIALLALRRLFVPRRRMSVAERVVCFVVAGACAAATLFLSAGMLFEDAFVPEMLKMLVGPTGVVAGVGLISWLVWRGRADDAAAAAMQVAYAANGAMCALMFAEDAEIGWWLTWLALAGVLAEQTVAIVRAARVRRGRRA